MAKASSARRMPRKKRPQIAQQFNFSAANTQNRMPVAVPTLKISAFGIRHSAFGIRHSAFGIRHSAFGIRHWAFDMIADLKFAVRMLLHSRGFTLAALMVLTLGIGATTTMFSATNAVLLRPLPYPDADRMVAVRETRAQAGFEKTIMSAREYVDWTRDSRVLRDAAIVDYPGLAVAIDNAAVRLGAMRVSAEFFPLFGVRPMAGRAFTREAEQPGSGDVVLISRSVWQERFGGAADVVGRTDPRRRTADHDHRDPAAGLLVHGRAGSDRADDARRRSC